MDRPTQDRSKARFGTFELDPASGELLKGGARVRLQEQPFQVLKALVERPGEVVSREELRQLLWPDDTFVDFEDGLSTAVKKVRQALGDSAANPRFIETLPKRGYRFVAPVEGLPLDLQSGRKPSRPTESSSAAPARRTGWYLAGLASVAAVVALGVWLGPSADPETSSTLLAPVPLTSYPGAETHPSFSPDGSQVAFSWVGDAGDNQDIYLAMVDGGSRSRLTDNPAQDIAPAWSPDGSSIAFLRRGEDIDEIYLISPLGGRERKLTEVPLVSRSAEFMNLSWSPDAQTLAFLHQPSPGPPLRIGLLSIATGELRSLTSPSAGSNGDLRGTFSPDGSAVAFVRMSGYRVMDVFLTTLDGSSPRQITRLAWNIQALAWSPNGTELLFTSEEPGTEVWRVGLEGGDPRPVVGLGQDVGSLAVSASSNRLAYTVRREVDRDIWRMPLDSSVSGLEAAEFIASTHFDGAAQVSFDGTRVAFRSERSGYPEIWVADRDGSNLARLTSLRASGGGTPRWSPDNRRIAFNSIVEGNLQIYVMPAQGGPPQALTSGKSGAARPAWSPDGEWVYFRLRNGISNIWRVLSEGGELERMTSDGGSNPKISPDGKTLYFTRPGTGSVWRMDIESGAQEHFFDLEGESVAGCYEPFEDGWYFLTRQEDDRVLKRLDYDTGQVTEVAVLERSVDPVNCFSLSPDRSWLLYSRADPDEVDLMLVENFE